LHLLLSDYNWRCEPPSTEKELRHKVNDAVSAPCETGTIRTGRLKVCGHRCPNLLAEAKLYRYPSPHERAVVGECPIDENNHALGALRYLISRLDARFIAKLRGKAPAEAPVEVEVIDHTDTQASVYGKKPRQITLMDNPDVWERLN
jgi:hypothetical protein